MMDASPISWRFLGRIAWLALTVGVLVACQPPEITQLTSLVGKCHVQREALSTAGTDIGAQLSSGVWGGGVQVADERALQLASGFDALQRDYDLRSAKLCADLEEKRITPEDYARLRACQDQGQDAQRAMQTTLAALAGGGAAVPQTRADWLLESQMLWLQQASACAPAVAVALPGGERPRTKGTLQLEAPASEDAERIALRAHLLCQRRQADGGYVDVPRCNHATLGEGDRVKFAFETDRAARVYLFLYNDTGQFQMVFPAPGIDNETVGGERYVLPPGEGWLELDDVSGVTEYVHLVASTHRVAELEALRGADVPPQAQPGVAQQVRGAVEPVLTRGFDLSQSKAQPLMLSPTLTVSSVPVDVEALDVVGVEFEIRHE